MRSMRSMRREVTRRIATLAHATPAISALVHARRARTRDDDGGCAHGGARASLVVVVVVIIVDVVRM
jgi:hypothetical protein